MCRGLEGYTQEYAVTVTLLPKVRKYTAVEQYDKYASEVVAFITQTFPLSKLTLVCELTKSFDIHFHGSIRFSLNAIKNVKNICRFFTDKFRKHAFIGYVCIKVVDNEPVWRQYISKTLKEFSDDVGRRPILRDDLIKYEIGMFEVYFNF